MAKVFEILDGAQEQDFILIMLPVQSYDALRALSKEKDMSISQLIAWIVSKYLNENYKSTEKKLLVENKWWKILVV